MSRVSWSKDPNQCDLLEELVTKTTKDYNQISDEVSAIGVPRTPDACRGRARTLRLSRPFITTSMGERAQLEQARRKANHFKRQWRALEVQHADVNNLIERMQESLASVMPMYLVSPPQIDYGDQEEEEAIALVSDVHVGVKSLGAEIGLTQPRVWGPLGSYNIQVLRYRLRLWLQGVISMVELHRQSVPVRKLNLWLLGDILENEWIFKGQGSYIETGLMQQFYVALNEFAQVLAILAAHFDEIEIRGVAGNHGRGTEKKGASKTWVNWEWLWLRYLELVCQELENVHFNLAVSWFDMPEVLGHTFLIMHGEDVRRYMRFPWYSVDRMEKAYLAMMTEFGMSFENLCFGHHHVAANFQTSHGEWFCNGNWVGPTMFAMKVLYETVSPKQWLLFCHEKRAITSRELVDLDKEDQDIWDEVEATEYDIHVPASNQDVLAAMRLAASRSAVGKAAFG